jgi:hypothetical protein
MDRIFESQDVLTRRFIHEHLKYRFALTNSYSEAMNIEAQLACGNRPVTPSFLNLIKTKVIS